MKGPVLKSKTFGLSAGICGCSKPLGGGCGATENRKDNPRLGHP